LYEYKHFNNLYLRAKAHTGLTLRRETYTIQHQMRNEIVA
jgi:hypothetical protein